MKNTSELQNTIVEGIQERKGKNITVIDLSEIESASSQGFIICEGTSATHVASIADSVREYVQTKTGIKPYNYDGYRNSQWIVIDYGELMIHIFLPEFRTFYSLEQLWSDAPITQIENLD